jgi:hypothetical protein
VTSPQVEVTSVEGNAFGATAGPTTFVADGWLAEVKDLSAGEHTLHLQIGWSSGETLVDEIVVTVAEDSSEDDDHGGSDGDNDRG